MKTEAVLVLLVESAALYCGVWVSTLPSTCHLSVSSLFWMHKILYIVSQLSVNEEQIVIDSETLSFATITFNEVMPSVLAQMAVRTKTLLPFILWRHILMQLHLPFVFDIGPISDGSHRACYPAKDHLGYD